MILSLIDINFNLFDQVSNNLKIWSFDCIKQCSLFLHIQQLEISSNGSQKFNSIDRCIFASNMSYRFSLLIDIIYYGWKLYLLLLLFIFILLFVLQFIQQLCYKLHIIVFNGRDQFGVISLFLVYFLHYFRVFLT